MHALIVTATLAASILVAEGNAAWVDLRWPDESCPTAAAISTSLQALGLRTMPPGESVPAQTPVAQVVATRQNGALELVIESDGRNISRTVFFEGSCDERAAVTAAIIERAVRPEEMVISYDPALLLSNRGSARNPELDREPPLAMQNNDDLAPDWDPSGVDAAEADNGHRYDNIQILHQPLWVFAGSLVIAGGEGPTVRGGADAEVRYEFSEEMFAVVRLSYRNPQIERIGTAAVRVDDGVAALGLQIGAPSDPFALQTTALIQIAWAQSIGFAEEHSIVKANPGFTVGACYQKGLGNSGSRFGIEVCVRGFGFLRRQEIHVNNTLIVGLPRVGGEMAIGVVYRVE